jgi:hypothetical protein
VKLPLPKRLARVDEIARRSTQVVPDVTPKADPVPPPTAPCGFCGFAREGHGIRYSTFGGTHQWRRTEPYPTSLLHPYPVMGDPR